MSRPCFFVFPFLAAILLVGCSDSLIDTDSQLQQRDTQTPMVGKLRHAHLAGQGSSMVAGKLAADSEVFVAYNEYEPDGVTRRVLDAYGVTRRVLEEYGVTRRVLDAYGVTRRVLEEYGITRRVLDSYGITRRVLESYGITGEELAGSGHNITDAFLQSFGLSLADLEAQGVTRRVLDEYGVTRRVLDDYGVSDAQWDKAIAAFERTVRLKVRIDGARPGVFLSLGTLPLATFMEEVADDTDIVFVEIDVTLSGPSVGTINKTNAGSELLPWGIEQMGAAGLETAGLEDVHVYLLDSGVRASGDLNLVERKDFTMLFLNRSQTTWDDSKIVEMPYFDPGSAGNPSDETGHGTHIAGTIGAMQNGSGVVGAAPGVAIHSLKVMTAEGQTDVTTVVSALDYVIAQKLEKPGVPMVANLSLGMDIQTRSYNVLDEAVRRATEYGVHVVVSAGNAAADAGTFSPAHVTEALTVGSYSPSGAFSPFSNFGASVDLLAPGDLIASTSGDAADEAANLAVLESGTSMAAGHVTGAIAMLLAQNPQAQPEFARNHLMATAATNVQGLPSGTANRAIRIGHSMLASASLPPFLQFAVAAAGNVDMKQGASIAASPERQLNGSVYAGATITSKGRAQGFGYYVKSENAWSSSFQPVYNPANLETTVEVDPLTIPQIDTAELMARAESAANFRMSTIEVTGDMTLGGEVVLGTEQAPHVWHISGDLESWSDVTVSGYGILLVDGNVWLKHSLTTAPRSEFAIFATGYARVESGINLSGHIVSNRYVNLSGNVTGSVTSGEYVAMSASADMIYSPITCVLTEALWPTGLCSSEGREAAPPVSDGSDDNPVATPDIVLETEASTTQRRHLVKLTWTGTRSGSVDVYRDGELEWTGSDSGGWDDSTWTKGSRTYVHKVCEAGTSICSGEVTTTY